MLPDSTVTVPLLLKGTLILVTAVVTDLRTVPEF